VTVSGDTAGTWLTDNSKGLEVLWALDVGTDFHGTTGAWNAGLELGAATDTNTWSDTTGNTFELTGVQLEVGSKATAFEHRSYGDELARCQRYYQENAVGGQTATGTTLVTHNLVPEMRATPTQALINAGSVSNASINTAFGNASTRSYYFQITATAANGYVVARSYSYTAEL